MNKTKQNDDAKTKGPLIQNRIKLCEGGESIYKLPLFVVQSTLIHTLIILCLLTRNRYKQIPIGISQTPKSDPKIYILKVQCRPFPIFTKSKVETFPVIATSYL